MSNLKKYDFNFNLSGLQEYTEQKTNTLISETILTGDFASLITVVPNVKGTQELNILSSTLHQLDVGCGWDPANSGQTTSYTQKSITSVKKQYQEELCVDDFFFAVFQGSKLFYGGVLHREDIGGRIEQFDHNAYHFKNQSLLPS